MPSTIDPNRIGEVIDSCAENMELLTPWDRQFIEVVSDQWDRRRQLTERQQETLEKIYVEKVP